VLNPPVLPLWVQTTLLIAGLALMLWLNAYGYLDKTIDAAGHIQYTTVAWPWFVPIGSTVAFLFGWLLARKQAPT
jgi:hypothetical protein